MSLLGVAWGVTIVMTYPGIMVPQYFPAGLCRLFGAHEEERAGRGLLFGGWLVYIVLTVASCLSKRKLTYFIVYSMLCALLVLNILGCRAFWYEFNMDVH